MGRKEMNKDRRKGVGKRRKKMGRQEQRKVGKVDGPS